ncbi:class I SAM-dependent DNA methyltransferase [Paracoccus onubensis]|uniref:site-specific DNA-methyltransferase (adenine-specific) n=1 Tax=Paracoccus onubensis TaxID=1675788 RepID=A0A418SWX2_9RHOB|nr:DNA methyltransferase [Paracoccus onubensis]RJE85467.1 class I SAM-dependent DNA methyltransferase [Paracoccus onubensis]
MNPTEIYDALAEIAAAPFDPDEFPFAFAEATDAAKAAISKLRGGSTNKSDLPGGVLFNRKFHYAPAMTGLVEATLDQLRASKKTRTAKPAILITTDGETVAAEHPASGERRHFRFTEIGDNFGFLLPAAGKERYRAVEENPVDVKATGKLARLYDALIKANPDWASDEHRHEMNQLMMRLIFCMFAEDVGIFPDEQFSRLIFTHAGNRGEEAREVIIAAFRAMNLPKDRRGDLPAWTRELEYVNGGLFAGAIDAPRFDTIAFRYLRDACDLNWRQINPDIFGSMIQSVADPKQRSELGMHYTSVPNIMKVIGPLFLDDLDAEIHKAWDRPRALQQVLDRMSRIRVFDPACGSGNFLVVSYRELRARETRILQRLEELNGPGSLHMWSVIPITNFYGIEIADFAAETAKLALFIAEYQANASFAEVFGRSPAALPLKDAANIRTGNALRIDWEEVCPPPADGEEVFIAGNPPYYGAKKRESWQTEDMVQNGLGDLQLLDYVSVWFFKAARYAAGSSAFAFVATSSICQGEQVAPMWNALFETAFKIHFAYRPFIWKNSAADNAGVWVTIIGMKNVAPTVAKLFDDAAVSNVKEISPYLVPFKYIPVTAATKSIFSLPVMVMGSNPVDGKWLSVSSREREEMIETDPRAEKFILPYLGGDELIDGKERHCIWIDDEDLQDALSVRCIKERVDSCAAYRKTAGRDARKAADIPHRFCYSTYRNGPSLAIPNSQSSDREFIPAVMASSEVVISKEAFAIYYPPNHMFSIISSSLHRLWLATVGGRIGNGFRYSVRVVYNTFPVPKFTEEELAALTTSARAILKCRYSHYPKTITELYDPDGMPDDLRAVHRQNDDLLETMYIGRPFRNDTERLEKLFKLYAARVKALDKGGK